MKNGGMPPTLSVAASAPVRTHSTPGAALALLASSRLMIACACGESTATPKHWRGNAMSATNCPAPVVKRWSSTRRTACPIPNLLMSESFGSGAEGAVDHERRSAGVARSIGGQKADGLRNLLGPRVTAERDLLVEPFAGIAAKQLAHGLLGGAHEHIVDRAGI